MRQVAVRELNQHTADVLARVEVGERIEITRNGVAVAILEPVTPSPLGELIDSGELILARSPLPLIEVSDEVAPDAAGSDAVVADRDQDSRW